MKQGDAPLRGSNVGVVSEQGASDDFHGDAALHAALLQIMMRFWLAHAAVGDELGFGFGDGALSVVAAFGNGACGAHGVHLQKHGDGTDEFGGAYGDVNGEEIFPVAECALAAFYENEQQCLTVQPVGEFDGGDIAQFCCADDDAAVHLMDGAQHFGAGVAAIAHCDAAVHERLRDVFCEGVVV